MAKNKALLRTIGLIYEASLDKDLWPRVIAEICDLTDSSLGVMSPADRTNYCLNFLHEIDPALEPRARQHFHDNPYMKHRHRLPSGTAVLGHRLATRREIEESAFFQEVHRPMNGYHVCTVAFHNEPELFGELSVFRSEAQEPHGETELALANAVAPHVRRAARVSSLLEGSSPQLAGFQALAGRFTFGLVLLGHNAGILYASPRAEAMLRNGPFTILNGQVIAAGRARGDTVAQLTDRARAAGHVTATILDRPDRSPIQLVAVPLPKRRHDFAIVTRQADVALLCSKGPAKPGFPAS